MSRFFSNSFLFLTLFLWCMPTLAIPLFQATVDTTQVVFGETLTLKLELSDTTTNHEPDLTPLQDSFEVDGQQQFQSTQIINGVITSQIGWQYTLTPKKQGTLIIPELTWQTVAGKLQSKPIEIQVTTKPVGRKDGIQIETLVTDSNPYLYQPVFYILRLYHRGELRDLEPIPPPMTDGIVLEQLGQLSERQEVVNGVEMFVSKIAYILTPLRQGTLQLTAGKMKGLKLDGRQGQFGGGFFGFNSYLPVTISSSPKTLQVQAAEYQPWLPLLDLKVERQWESDISKPVTVGVPLVCTLAITALGMGGQALPSWENLLPNSADIRVRTPKPEVKRELSPNHQTPVSQITQSYSLIPLKTGTLSLPAIRIPWWNVAKRELAWVDLPAQTLEVVAGPIYQPTPIVEAGNLPRLESAAVPSISVNQVMNLSQVQYAFLSLAIFALFIALGHSWYSRYYPSSSRKAKSSTVATFSLTALKKRLMAIDELSALKLLLQEYAHSRWQTPRQASLSTIASFLREEYDNTEPLMALLKELEAAWYGQFQLNVAEWKQRLLTVLNDQGKICRRKSIEKPTMIFTPLNP